MPFTGSSTKTPGSESPVLRKCLAPLFAVLTVLYPAMVYLTLDRFAPVWIALLLVSIALARAWILRSRRWLLAAAAAAVLAAICLLTGEVLALQLYPVVVNLVFLAVFAFSLWRPPSVVERLARLREPMLPPEAVAYTRRVTQVWCGFFVLNGSLALYTALWASPAQWAFYNGFVAYVLMATLFAIEWLVRRRVRGRIAARETARG